MNLFISEEKEENKALIERVGMRVKERDIIPDVLIKVPKGRMKRPAVV